MYLYDLPMHMIGTDSINLCGHVAYCSIGEIELSKHNITISVYACLLANSCSTDIQFFLSVFNSYSYYSTSHLLY